MNQNKIDRALLLRENAINAAPGDQILCPWCEKQDIKTEFHNVYCSETCRYSYNQHVAKPIAKELRNQHIGVDPFGPPTGNFNALGHR